MSIVEGKILKKIGDTKKVTENFSAAFLWSSHVQFTYFGNEK